MQLKSGDIVEGKITGITSFGVFADIGDGLSGMVHISEISRDYVSDIREFVKVGDTAKMKVISVGEDGKISLSIRKALPDEPERRKEKKKYEPKAVVPPDPSYVWEASKDTPSSFEEMMNRFKQRSDEKISDLKRKNPDARRGKRSSGGK
ncbi:MAG: S1 RNA-binding domain-containing protein [Clostridia bacterium]|nr:S1 RNA-binding domain-containing protein [Clostridia bacterium]